MKEKARRKVLQTKLPVRVVSTHSAIETSALGYRIGQQLSANSILSLFGELGAGKTTFVKGLARAVAGVTESEVVSPTFVYLHIYDGPRRLYHFDLYRLACGEEFLSMGFDEMLTAGGVCCIEWAERIEGLLPENQIRITLEHAGEDKRRIILEGCDEPCPKGRGVYLGEVSTPPKFGSELPVSEGPGFGSLDEIRL